MKTVLLLGGYGNFGKRIAENLSSEPDIILLIAGRSLDKATSLVSELQMISSATLQPVAIDINTSDFESRLNELKPTIVIHTSGPFQGQDYRVPKACINVGAHYIDLADDRRFVCDFTSLNELAARKNVLAVSGASSVPGFSSAVIDHYQPSFSSIESLDIAIAPGNKAERGEATVRGILSYTGYPFSIFNHGQWCNAYGWMNPRLEDFGGVLGRRWLSNVDVPDLELFPERYSVTRSVRFQAGLELPVLHLSMVLMAAMARIGLIRNWSTLTKPLVKTSELFMRYGSDQGGMQVHIKGTGQQGQEKSIKWTLYAENGVGPYIPTLSSIIIAKKLLAKEIKQTGATQCLGLYTLDEFLPYAEDLGIYFREQVIG